MLDRCGFCGGSDGPFTRVEGVFTVLICPRCLADRARGRGPYPDLTDAEIRAGLDQLRRCCIERSPHLAASTSPLELNSL